MCLLIFVNEDTLCYMCKTKYKNKLHAEVDMWIESICTSDCSFLDPSKQLHCSNLLTLKVNVKILSQKSTLNILHTQWHTIQDFYFIQDFLKRKPVK